MYPGDNGINGSGRQQQQQQQQPTASPPTVRLEPIRERIIAIQPSSSVTAPEHATYYNNYSAGAGGAQTPVAGGLRYLFRRRSNADVTRPVTHHGGATPSGGFSVSIGPSAGGGGRLSLLVQPTSPGTRVNLVIPPSSNVIERGGNESPRIGSHVTYSISSSPISRSLSPSSYTLPPSYEESIRNSAATTRLSHQRSPSLQDFGAAAEGVFPRVLPHQQRQQQLSVPGMMANTSRSPPPPSSLPGYSQTLQVDTGLRQYQSPSSSSPRHASPIKELPSASPGTDNYMVYRQPPSLSWSPADRQTRLDQVRGRPHSGDLDLTTPGATGASFDSGRSSSPLILAPTGLILETLLNVLHALNFGQLCFLRALFWKQ